MRRACTCRGASTFGGPVVGIQVQHYRIQHQLDLRGNDTQDLDGNAVELVETSPASRLAQPLENVSHGLVVHLVAAVEHHAREPHGTSKVFGGLRLAGSGRSCGRTCPKG